MKKFLSKIYLILTLDCEQSAKLTSDSLDRDLDWSEYVAKQLHLLICSKSRKLNKQILQLNDALAKGPITDETQGELSFEAKERIRERLQKLKPE